MPSETIEFDSPRTLQSLLGRDLGSLKAIESAFDVRMVSREGWVKMEGDEAQLARVRRVFDQLSEAQRQGLEIGRHEVAYAIDSAKSGGSEDLSALLDTRIACSPTRPPILPKSRGQLAYIKAIQKHDLVFGIGPAGTGKTYLAMALAVAALKREEVTRIILTRPAVEAGEALGFLPGDLAEKIAPYLRPLYDALYDMIEAEQVEKFIERGVVEVAPLAYMRGRTLNRAFVILDEAQNTTTEQMFMFLTRLGVGSKCVVTGDDTQIDLPNDRRSGLVEARQALATTEGIAFAILDETDVVRHPIVQSIVRAYRDFRGGSERT